MIVVTIPSSTLSLAGASASGGILATLNSDSPFPSALPGRAYPLPATAEEPGPPSGFPSTVSGFTPINRPQVHRTSEWINDYMLHEPEGLGNPSNKGTKRNLSQLTIPPLATKKPRKVSQPKEFKRAKKIPIPKHYSTEGRNGIERVPVSELGQRRMIDHDPLQEMGEAGKTQPDVHKEFRISSKTVDKLAAFWYDAGVPETNGSAVPSLAPEQSSAYESERSVRMMAVDNYPILARQTGSKVDIPAEHYDSDSVTTQDYEATSVCNPATQANENCVWENLDDQDPDEVWLRNPTRRPNLVSGLATDFLDVAAYPNESYHYSQNNPSTSKKCHTNFDHDDMGDCHIEIEADMMELHQDEDKEDEFRVGDMKEPLKLRMIGQSFKPPSSLQDSFGATSEPNEICGHSLQYPRPHSVISLHPPQTAGEIVSMGKPTTIDVFRSAKTQKTQPSLPLLMDDNDNRLKNNLLPGEREEEDKKENFLDNDLDPDVLELAVQASELVAPPQATHAIETPSPQKPKLLWNTPRLYLGSQVLPAPGKPSPSSPVTVSSISPEPKRLSFSSLITVPDVSPITRSSGTPKITQPLAPHLVAFDANGRALPFARSPFPSPILDRSPILGLSCSPLLRTCFRIGEAFNAAFQAAHKNIDLLIELYAVVTYSRRVGVEQFFQFADLFRSEKPPFLKGMYTGWNGVELWDVDSKGFLGDNGMGRMSRCIGRMKREEVGRGWKMVVLSIWEASWEDVGYTKGVVCS